MTTLACASVCRACDGTGGTPADAIWGYGKHECEECHGTGRKRSEREMNRSLTDTRLWVVPLTLREANELIAQLHRHHKPVVGHRFTIGAMCDGALVGAAVVGRPTARMTEQYRVAEVTRLVTDGFKNACSMLYGHAARAAQAMGFEDIQTFILEDEPGTSLKAAGWHFEAWSGGGDWNRPSRGDRRTDQPMGRKQKWMRHLNEFGQRRCLLLEIDDLVVEAS